VTWAKNTNNFTFCRNELKQYFDQCKIIAIEPDGGAKGTSLEAAARNQSLHLNGIRRGIFLSPFIQVLQIIFHFL